MKILITGSVGFIGFSLTNHLLKKKKIKIFGIDNINNYYDTNLKLKRLKLLQKNKNFRFRKLDINNSKELEKIFKKNNGSLCLSY